jgi:hypothetical protein
MSPAGRTTWWGKDAAWHRRELVVELGEEFGAEGPMVLDVLSAWAQEQRDAGAVRGGFRTLARESFVTVCHAQSIVARAAEIGALDDLKIDEDGRRFECRVSGWHSDQQRARAAARQAAKRNQTEETTVTDRDIVTPRHGASRDVTEKPLPDHTVKNPPTPQGEERAKLLTFGKAKVSDEQRILAEAILHEFNQQAGTGYGAYRGDGKPSEDLKRILGALRDADPPLTLAEAGRVIRWRLAHPFGGRWEGKPHTGVVFGPSVFAANRESARPGASTAKSSLELAREIHGGAA